MLFWLSARSEVLATTLRKPKLDTQSDRKSWEKAFRAMVTNRIVMVKWPSSASSGIFCLTYGFLRSRNHSSQTRIPWFLQMMVSIYKSMVGRFLTVSALGSNHFWRTLHNVQPSNALTSRSPDDYFWYYRPSCNLESIRPLLNRPYFTLLPCAEGSVYKYSAREVF